MTNGPAVLDSDTLSELSRGHPRVVANARAYLAEHGRLTFTSITVFERLRGYRAALRAGKPYETHLQQFSMLVAASIVLPFDEDAADYAAVIWAGSTPKGRSSHGDILIAGIAVSRRLPIVTRNKRDFEPLLKLSGPGLKPLDWTK